MALSLEREGVALNAVERNKRNANLSKIEEALNEASGALPEAQAAKSLAQNVQTQLSTLVVQGDSSPQATQASVGADGTEYGANLKARLDAEYNRTILLLAETATRQEIVVERSRIDNLIELPEGSTLNDARLEDIKVGANGTIYASPGAAVRNQVLNVESVSTNVL